MLVDAACKITWRSQPRPVHSKAQGGTGWKAARLPAWRTERGWEGVALRLRRCRRQEAGLAAAGLCPRERLRETAPAVACPWACPRAPLACLQQCPLRLLSRALSTSSWWQPGRGRTQRCRGLACYHWSSPASTTATCCTPCRSPSAPPRRPASHPAAPVRGRAPGCLRRQAPGQGRPPPPAAGPAQGQVHSSLRLLDEQACWALQPGLVPPVVPPGASEARARRLRRRGAQHRGERVPCSPQRPGLLHLPATRPRSATGPPRAG